MPDCAEWGYINLPELETVNAHDGLTIVERDCHWEPKCFAEIDVNGVQPTYGEKPPFTENSCAASPLVGARLSLRLRV